MVGLILDSGYERISNTISLNSAQKIKQMALLFARIKFKIVFSSCLRTCTSEIFFRANHGGPIVDFIEENV